MHNGFTLLEIVITMGILALLATLTLPLTTDAYRSFVLDSELKNFISILRRSQSFAMSNKLESDYGVKLQPDNFVVFKGSSFVARDPDFDENYPREGAVTITGFDEIVFQRLSGSPTATATAELSAGSGTRIININRYGSIDW